MQYGINRIRVHEKYISLKYTMYAISFGITLTVKSTVQVIKDKKITSAILQYDQGLDACK
jgi:hypothetical protein